MAEQSIPEARTPKAPPAEAADGNASPGDGMSRRKLLGTAGATGLVLGAAGGAVGYAAAPSGATPLSSLGSDRAMFHGKHQPGITEGLQARGHLVAFDLAAGAGRKEAAALLRRWSVTAELLMSGEAAAHDDTDVARDAGPSSLTLTFGFGHSFFSRTGLEKQRPVSLDPLPDFSSDHLDKARSNGDLWVQIGADDALVAFHALRAIQKDAGSTARIRWQMNGFNRTPGATAHTMTARNLMGQLDGTRNPKPAESDFDKRIFVPSSGANAPAWMANGSYAVVRRIRMLLDDWEKLSLTTQENVIGRRKADGAPLSGGTETTPMDLDKADSKGEYVVPVNAHARITRPDQNGGAAILRRPFSYHDGFDADGVPDAGLLFVCWQADPLQGFVPLQRKLDRGDALSKYIRHEASGLFAVPGGAARGEYVGQRLLEG
ncbi:MULTISPECIES: iron uptake transporter deferrochelatase/peroxidase subunit [unclassified Streptomyces]|uniref:iron uptake transporter deferrochelatase/peroxidase subunit n=1 Tax=unclassified Streptomyces TaxID=2593676 RepID=UPI0022599E26|nr:MULTISPECIES: iron uptake transporter deferrochelatase/peroxidase subunit [unclassified Streptomyces]MCX5049452.1 iron uptake transporter deferrochelatase/peroxidase subunit [Streptomyces sp. NBC_00474]MCX5055803.1 iron uptake transporter deferrochelatase/peroxidase subunit [Streptomyces sp. NBC_00452]